MKEIEYNADVFWANNENSCTTEDHPSKAIVFDSSNAETVEVDCLCGAIVFVGRNGRTDVVEFGDFEDYGHNGGKYDLVFALADYYNDDNDRGMYTVDWASDNTSKATGAENMYAVERMVDMHGDGERDYAEVIAWFLDEQDASLFADALNKEEPGAHRVIEFS